MNACRILAAETLLVCSLVAVGCQPGKPGLLQASRDISNLSPTFVDLGDTPFPEGIAVTRDGILYTGSLTTGKIVSIEGAGVAKPFSNLNYGALGLKIDETRGVLWACDGSPFDPELPSDLVALSLEDGSRLATHPVPVTSAGIAPLCDDMFVTADGDIYVTDVHSSNIHYLPSESAMTDGFATRLWADNTGPLALNPDGLPFGANGIAVKDNHVYVSNSSRSSLVQIEITSDGKAGERRKVELVDLDGNPYPLRTPDGIYLYRGDLFSIETPGIFDPAANSRLVKISIDTTGDHPRGIVSVVAEGLDTPTAVTVNKDYAWVTVSQFDHLFEIVSEPVTRFQVAGLPID